MKQVFGRRYIQLKSATGIGILILFLFYDLLGREVAVLVDEVKDAGNYPLRLTRNGLRLTSGVYFYQLRAGSFVETKQMIMLK